MNNLISTCFVIAFRNGYVDPTIYLTQPESTEETKIHMFDNPFAAKNFIQMWMQNVEITVRKQAI